MITATVGGNGNRLREAVKSVATIAYLMIPVTYRDLDHPYSEIRLGGKVTYMLVSSTIESQT